MKTYFALFCLVVAIGAANAAVNTTKCHACLEDNFSDCDNMDIDNCTAPETDSCFSAAGRYKFNNGSTAHFYGVSRGCVPCHNVTVGCHNFKMWFDNLPQNWTLVDCNIVCCKGDKCNNGTVTFPDLTTTSAGTGSTTPSGMTDTEAPSHATRHFPAAVMLAIAAIVGTFFFN